MSRNEDFDNAIWSHPRFEQLSPNAALLYIWSWTNPRCGMAGLYEVGVRTMMESKVELDDIGATLRELEEACFAFYEDDVLWVRTRARRLRTKSVQMAKAVVKDVVKIAEWHPLRVRWVAMYRRELWLQGALNEAGVNLKGTLSGIGADSDILSLTRGSGEAHLSLRGRGRGSSTTKDGGSRGLVARAVDQDSFPSSLPLELGDVTRLVTTRLCAVQSERGGNVPTVRGVGLALVAFPDRDHVMVLAELEHWALAGRGQAKPVKDWAKTYRTFLERTPAGKPSKVDGGPPADFSAYNRKVEVVEV